MTKMKCGSCFRGSQCSEVEVATALMQGIKVQENTFLVHSQDAPQVPKWLGFVPPPWTVKLEDNDWST